MGRCRLEMKIARESCQREAELSSSVCAATASLMDLLPTAVVGRGPLWCSLASQLTGGGRTDGGVDKALCRFLHFYSLLLILSSFYSLPTLAP